MGLSPRVRGNRTPTQRHRPPGGSIPACAGEPRAPATATAAHRVYPRVCGGTGHIRYAAATVMGLSPRVRGNLHLRGLILRPLGSIPACAGEPRRSITDWSGRGSIPACAGEPVGWHWQACYPGVYPRVCGGTDCRDLLRAHNGGLSPRVRGNRCERSTLPRCPGSIPACAGEPSCSPPRRKLTWVYPRVCGGTASHLVASRTASGLSPRVRGNRVPIREGGSVHGVYPRVCGGTGHPDALGLEETGLSPRVRGNRDIVGCIARRIGSIPACAGEP